LVSEIASYSHSGIAERLVGYEPGKRGIGLEEDESVRIDEPLSGLLPGGRVPVTNAIRAATTLTPQIQQSSLVDGQAESLLQRDDRRKLPTTVCTEPLQAPAIRPSVFRAPASLATRMVAIFGSDTSEKSWPRLRAS
jgi:hypothetical protein